MGKETDESVGTFNSFPLFHNGTIKFGAYQSNHLKNCNYTIFRIQNIAF